MANKKKAASSTSNGSLPRKKGVNKKAASSTSNASLPRKKGVNPGKKDFQCSKCKSMINYAKRDEHDKACEKDKKKKEDEEKKRLANFNSKNTKGGTAPQKKEDGKRVANFNSKNTKGGTPPQKKNN